MAKFERIDLGLKEAYDELFMNDEERKENKLPKIYDVPLSEIDDFPDHPFKVKIDEDMEQLVESIKQRGVITPVTLREKADGRYELISGHRRKKACEIAGLETIKAEIKDLDRDEAIILMNVKQRFIKWIPVNEIINYKNGLVQYFANSELRKELLEKKAFTDDLLVKFKDAFKEYTKTFVLTLKDYKASQYGDVRELGL